MAADPVVPAAAGLHPARSIVPAAVIDTNVWLDLFVFQDAAARPLAQALRSGLVQAVRSARTDAELPAVMARPPFATRLSRGAAEALIAAWRSLAQDIDEIRSAPWVCRDPDDQKFLDLAFSAPADLLFTKDRALLDMARRARGGGLLIIKPGTRLVPGALPLAAGSSW